MYSAKYMKDVRHAFNMLSKSFDMDMKLSQLSIRELERFFIDTYKRAPYGAFNYYRTIKSAFSKAVNWEYIKENPLKKIKIQKPPKKHPVFLNREELELILENEKKEKYRDFYVLAFYTGMRLNEISQLRWYAVDFRLKEIKVMNDKNFTSKNKSDRIIPMNSVVYDLLLARQPKITSINRDDFVFEKVKGVSLRGETVSNNFRKALRKTNLDRRIHFHSLRHSFASNLVMKGVSLFVVKELLGHSDYATTQIYAHLQKETLANAVSLLI